jgi:hypothetical protein
LSRPPELLIQKKNKIVNIFSIILEKKFSNKKRLRDFKNGDPKQEVLKGNSENTNSHNESCSKKRSNQITKASELLQDNLLFNIEKANSPNYVCEEKEISTKELENEITVSAIKDPKVFMNLHFPVVYQSPIKGVDSEKIKDIHLSTASSKISNSDLKSKFKLFLNYRNEEIESEISSHLKPVQIWIPPKDYVDNDCIYLNKNSG